MDIYLLCLRSKITGGRYHKLFHRRNNYNSSILYHQFLYDFNIKYAYIFLAESSNIWKISIVIGLLQSFINLSLVLTYRNTSSIVKIRKSTQLDLSWFSLWSSGNLFKKARLFIIIVDVINEKKEFWTFVEKRDICTCVWDYLFRGLFKIVQTRLYDYCICT